MSDALSGGGFGLFDESLNLSEAKASQTSSVGLSGFSVLTFADAYEEGSEFGSNKGESYFTFVFDVNATMPFHLSGHLWSDTSEPLDLTSTHSVAFLRGPGVDLEFDTHDDPASGSGGTYGELAELDVDHHGVFEPGRYTFGLHTTASEYFGGMTGANFLLTAPEPTTCALLGLGFAVVGARRSRRARL